MTPLNVYRVRVSNLKEKLKEEKLSMMAVLQEIRREKQDVEWLESENKLL